MLSFKKYVKLKSFFICLKMYDVAPMALFVAIGWPFNLANLYIFDLTSFTVLQFYSKKYLDILKSI